MAELIRQLRTSRFVPAVVLTLALVILGAAIYYGADKLRDNIRAQMVSRDGEILHAVALARQSSDTAHTNLAARLADPGEQLALALQLSQIKEGVVAVRLFDARGKFITAFPPYVSEGRIGEETLGELKQVRPVSRYLPKAALGDLFLPGVSTGEVSNTTPLIEVNIPIHARGEGSLLAAAQLVLDARGLERELWQLDDSLGSQAGLTFVVGGALLTVALVWAYRRLEKSNSLLRERTARLLRANHELALAAKTGAVGAVTAHLVHGLSNPLANLQDFVASHGDGAENPDWTEAAAATARMQKLVHEVVRVLGEEGGVDRYEIALTELAGILSDKVGGKAREAGVNFSVQSPAEGALSNRDANLVLLILENLVLNAVQVTPRGKTVRVDISRVGHNVVCHVADEGPGFPPQLLKNIFTPCRSTKGGNGIGLAISRQLANQIGAKLDLSSTGEKGCVFELELPRSVLSGEGDPVAIVGGETND